MNYLIYYVTAYDAFYMIVFILLFTFLPAIISGNMANNREIAVVPWVLLSLALSFIAPILLGVVYQTPHKVAMRRKAIEVEYDNMCNKKTSEQ